MKAKKELKRTYRILKSITIWKILLAMFLLIGFYTVFSAVTKIHIGMTSCESNSMNGALNCACLMVYTEELGTENIGDIYIYRNSMTSNSRTIHRLTGYCNYTDSMNVTHYTGYLMKGDSKFNSDWDECISPTDVIGKYLFSLC